MTTDELIKWARQWAKARGAYWLYPKDSPEYQERIRLTKEAADAIQAAGLNISVSDFGTVVIEMPFQV